MQSLVLWSRTGQLRYQKDVIGPSTVALIKSLELKKEIKEEKKGKKKKRKKKRWRLINVKKDGF